MEMDAGDRRYSIEMQRDELVRIVEDPCSKLQRFIEQVAGQQAVTLVLSHRVAALPGLSERLRGEALPAGAAANGALRHRHQLGTDGDEMLFVTCLPLEEPGNASA